MFKFFSRMVHTQFRVLRLLRAQLRQKKLKSTQKVLSREIPKELASSWGKRE